MRILSNYPFEQLLKIFNLSHLPVRVAYVSYVLSSHLGTPVLDVTHPTAQRPAIKTPSIQIAQRIFTKKTFWRL